MLPRLDSKERLNEINDAAVGSGRLGKHDSRNMIQRLERAAQGGVRPKAAKASPAMLGGMGIAVVSAPAAAPGREPSDD